MARITVIGAGGVGTAIADRLSLDGHEITLVSREFAGSLESAGGITTYKAAGIGCIFKPSSPFVGKLVLDSYEEWMALARDQKNRAVMETDLRIVTQPNEEIKYASQVEEFRRIDENTAQYKTYSFNPTILLQDRLTQMRIRGVVFEKRNITTEEVKSLKEGMPLEGSDYTVEAIGLAARDIHPNIGLYPIAGVLVHYIDRDTGDLRDSYMCEDKALYVVTRPSLQGKEIILGGTFLEHIGDMSDVERQKHTDTIIDNAKQEFCSRGFDLNRLANGPRCTTVGYRPGMSGDPVIQQNGKVMVVTGFGGQGLVTNFAVAKIVSDQIGAVPPDHFPGIQLPRSSNT
ncbi:MAG: NAD(P)/FAD-dependent oxidoreductase [Pseudomonadota bacterium]